jgi:hypothetical protein
MCDIQTTILNAAIVTVIVHYNGNHPSQSCQPSLSSQHLQDTSQGIAAWHIRQHMAGRKGADESQPSVGTVTVGGSGMQARSLISSCAGSGSGDSSQLNGSTIGECGSFQPCTPALIASDSMYEF